MQTFMKNLLISGYRSYELNVFNRKDPKLPYIKKVLRENFIQAIEEGTQWFLIGGQLGTELWSGEVLIELKKEYPDIRLSIIFPFKGFGEKWNEENKLLLEKVTNGADYVNWTSKEGYTKPRQLQQHQQFMVDHTHGALLLYDTEFEGKSTFLYNYLKNRQEHSPYPIQLITFEDLEESVREEDDGFID
ncbi:DUF1273 domain-containing protein [Lacticigenium naphthae]|uniref:DUF1273 domain-containing protein n=1 Tax=Lacticigenium naphthae TaxID=515351 RepID=UPI000401C544|nr:DUF1273 domain-containing protein [Lacticigenium naphthae]